MWIMFAFLSAFFAGVTAVVAKLGVKRADSDLVTALRTAVVLVFSWLMVLLAGSLGELSQVPARTLLFLGLSGLATGGSWLCYFKALQLGDVNRVAPVDKSSTLLTMLLAFIFLGEPISWLGALGMAAIAAGTLLMLDRRGGGGEGQKSDPRWFGFAALSALFASLTAILGKIGISGVESNLGTALRTCVVLVMAWLIVIARGKLPLMASIDRKSLGFIVLSGLTTGGSWLCYYRALRDGPASVVVPIDKLSILVTVAFSALVLRERLSRRGLAGLALLTAGTLSLLIKL